jgi:hypothetical protein
MQHNLSTANQVRNLFRLLFPFIGGLTHYLGQDKDAEEMKADSKEFVFVAGKRSPLLRVLQAVRPVALVTFEEKI